MMCGRRSFSFSGDFREIKRTQNSIGKMLENITTNVGVDGINANCTSAVNADGNPRVHRSTEPKVKFG